MKEWKSVLLNHKVVSFLSSFDVAFKNGHQMVPFSYDHRPPHRLIRGWGLWRRNSLTFYGEMALPAPGPTAACRHAPLSQDFVVDTRFSLFQSGACEEISGFTWFTMGLWEFWSLKGKLYVIIRWLKKLGK